MVVRKEAVKQFFLLGQQLPLLQNVPEVPDALLFGCVFPIPSALLVIKLEKCGKLAPVSTAMTADFLNIICPTFTYGEDVGNLFSAE